MDSCCTISCESSSTKSSLCKTCNMEGKKVNNLTVQALIKEGRLYNFKPDLQYFYCSTENCDTVYFTASEKSAFLTEDIKTQIALKNKSRDGYICFCFGHTVKEIEDEIKAQDESNILKAIKEQVKRKSCACEVKNPSGKCCLAQIKKIVNAKSSLESSPVFISS